MSIPLNHHYVSQCQIKNFFNDAGEIFLYDKSRRNFYSRNSSKNIFSEKLANSIYKEGQIDHQTLENELKQFEDCYPRVVELISEAIETLRISKVCHDALVATTLFGIIGGMRNPVRKKEVDHTIENVFGQFKNYMGEEQKKGLEKLTEYKKHVRYSNVLSYSDMAIRIAKKMGGLDFVIWSIKSNDCFLLPDTSATNVRRKINEYFNPDIKEIAEIGFPLTDKIFVHARSKKLGQENSYINVVNENSSAQVTAINLHLFHFANNTVATSNEDYLRNFVKQTGTDHK